MASSAVPDRNYAAKQYNKKEQYVVEGYQYPSDLMGLSSEGGTPQQKYGANYVIFYINVNNESKMIKNKDNLVVPIDTSERVKKALAGKEYSQMEAVAGVAGLAGAGAALAKGAASFGGKTGALGAAAKGIGTGLKVASVPALGAAAVANNTENSKFSRPQKRLKTAIALHVPNQLSIRYGAGWSEEETFALQAVIDGGEAAARAMAEAGKALVNGGLGAAKNALGREGKPLSSIAANVALNKGPAGAALSAMTGLAPNPMKEQVFKGVDFRSFTMEYQFAPRSADESANVLNIIQAFKYHMHPEFKDPNNFLYLYPSEFDIEYYHDGEENLNIHRHTSCVLTELNVNYTPNGNFSTFKGGMPTQINVSMTFKELTVLTKELIAEGL